MYFSNKCRDFLNYNHTQFLHNKTLWLGKQSASESTGGEKDYLEKTMMVDDEE